MNVKFVPYLILEGGRAEEAVKFYQEVFDAELIMMQKLGDLPGDSPAELTNQVLHAHLRIQEGAELYLCDSFPMYPYQQGNNVTICINTEDASITKSLFEALADGGVITHPLEETFFSPAFGTVRDKFGVTFTISTQQVT